MSFPQGFDGLLYDEAAEASWLEASVAKEAEREFSRSRRLATMRMISRILRPRGKRSGQASQPLHRDQDRTMSLALSDLSGTVDELGRCERGIGPMSRGLLASWKRSFAAMEVELDESPFLVLEEAGELYLEGGSAALIRAEISRLRGQPAIKAIVSRRHRPLAVERERAECACAGAQATASFQARCAIK